MLINVALRVSGCVHMFQKHLSLGTEFGATHLKNLVFICFSWTLSNNFPIFL